MPTYFVQNFGCRASQADGAAIETTLSGSGMTRLNAPSSAEFVILNTCTVTSTADDEIKQIVRRVHRANPQARIVVTGCMAQRAPDELIDLPGVSLVVGNSHKARIAELINSPFHGEVYVGDINSAGFTAPEIDGAAGDRARPNLKVQDGCSNKCSFCIIPTVRGRSRSAPVAQVVEQVRRLSKEFPEIVLTGINLGRWGREPGFDLRLAGLLRMILAETDLQRVRLSSVEPMDWSDDLLELVATSPRIAKHIHAPLQSGSDTVLRRMYRKYRPKHYEGRIRLARSLMRDAAIGADVMVGFPGETGDEFRQTCDFVESLPLTYLHIFPYSERPGTAAASCADQVPWVVRKERGRILKEIAVRKNREFRQRHVGGKLSAVTLNDNTALSSNYLQVDLAHPRPSKTIIDVTVGELTESGVRERSSLKVLA